MLITLLPLLCGFSVSSRAILAQYGIVGEIRLKPDQVARDSRFAGIEIALAGGEFETIRVFPTGWQIMISRQSPGHGTLTMTMTDGGKPLSLAEVRDLGIHVRRYGTGDQEVSTSGHLTLLTADSVKREIPFGRLSFEYVDVYLRQRLR